VPLALSSDRRLPLLRDERTKLRRDPTSIFDVKRVFADIDADHRDRCAEFLRHGVLVVLSAPRQLLVLAGPEHGRTIPLADLVPFHSKLNRLDHV